MTKKMYDFGVLKKWSKETLVEHLENDFISYGDTYDSSNWARVIKSIEKEYNNKKDSLKACISGLESIKVKKLDLKELRDSLRYLKEYEEELEGLEKSYKLYRNVIENLKLPKINTERFI